MAADPFADIQSRTLAGLGATVRRLRVARGLTGATLGQKTYLSQPQISRIEKGRQLLSLSDITRIVDALELSHEERGDLLGQYALLTLEGGNRRRLESIGYIPVMRKYNDLERAAPVNRVFDLSIIPGLIQTDQYVRGMLSHYMASMTAEDIDAAVHLRMERQRILWEQGRRFEFLLFETAIYAKYCAVEDHLAQLDRVRVLARRKNIDIGIVPARITPPGLLATFQIVGDTGVIVETLTEDDWIDNPADVSRYLSSFDGLSRLALRGDDLTRELELAMDQTEASRNISQ